MFIIAGLFPDVKNWVLLHQLFQVPLSNAVEGHDGVFEIRIICVQYKPQNNVQVGIRQTLYGEYGAGVFDVLDQDIRCKNGFAPVLLKQRIIFRVAVFDVRDSFICDNDLCGLQMTKYRDKRCCIDIA